MFTKGWYKWSANAADFKLTAFSFYRTGDEENIVIGTAEERILTYDPTEEKDFIQDDIRFNVKTGIVYPDNDTTKIKGFKQVGILYKTKRQAIDFDVKFKIDNFDTQILNVVRTPTADLLGASFILGSSVLGFKEVLLPENLSVDGYGYGCSIEIESREPIEVYGYSIDFEFAGDQREVLRGE